MPARKPTTPTGVYPTPSGYRWIIELGRDPLTNKRRQEQKSGYRTAREAERARAVRLAEIERGINTAPSRDTVAGWLATWLEAHAREVTPATDAAYHEWQRWYIVPLLGDVRLRDLSPVRVQRWHTQLLSGEPRSIVRPNGERRTITRALAPGTVMQAHTLLVMALDAALVNGLVPHNAAHLAGGVLVEAPEPRYWTEAEVRQFERDARDDGLYPLWYLAVWSGLRIGELLALCWEDVDLKAGVVRVRRTRTHDANRKPIIAPRTKTRQWRDVELPSACVTVLREHRDQQTFLRRAADTFWHDEGLVFANDVGQMRSYSAVRQHLVRLCERIGVPVVPPHALRHTHGTLMGAAGAGQREIADKLGHRSLKTTERYVHSQPGRQRESLERMRERLDVGGEDAVADDVGVRR